MNTAKHMYTKRATVVWNDAVMLTSLAAWVLFSVVPAFAQSQLAANVSAAYVAADATTPPENVAGPELQTDNTLPPPEAQSPDLASDENQSDASKRQALSTTPPSEPSKLTFDGRVRMLKNGLFSPETLIGPAFGSAIGQLENEPPAWGQGAEGYFHRFGSGVARHEIAATIAFGFAAFDREDPRYFRSDQSGLWPRAKHAVVSTFVSHTSNGTAVPAFSRFAGIYSAAFISNAWYPSNRANTPWALRRGSTALASSIAFHLIREFWPDIKNHLHLGSKNE